MSQPPLLAVVGPIGEAEPVAGGRTVVLSWTILVTPLVHADVRATADESLS